MNEFDQPEELHLGQTFTLTANQETGWTRDASRGCQASGSGAAGGRGATALSGVRLRSLGRDGDGHFGFFRFCFCGWLSLELLLRRLFCDTGAFADFGRFAENEKEKALGPKKTETTLTSKRYTCNLDFTRSPGFTICVCWSIDKVSGVDSTLAFDINQLFCNIMVCKQSF